MIGPILLHPIRSLRFALLTAIVWGLLVVLAASLVSGAGQPTGNASLAGHRATTPPRRSCPTTACAIRERQRERPIPSRRSCPTTQCAIRERQRQRAQGN
jgi:hypothetical protein